ncbi:MAG: hypothetical protein R3250_03330 [Melioribacteraceae bacterium]|nr:hypothetical protein [Melioribacteraceae bacterium]
MKEKQYLHLIHDQLHDKAKQKNLSPTDEISIDWGEMKFLLDRLVGIPSANEFEPSNEGSITSEQSSQENTNIENCYLCNKEMTVTRNEQIAILDSGEVKAKCFDCVFSQIKLYRSEAEQLLAYRVFVKEHRLEDLFEYFWEEQRKKPH